MNPSDATRIVFQVLLRDGDSTVKQLATNSGLPESEVRGVLRAAEQMSAVVKVGRHWRLVNRKVTL